jgi:CheY-like chemotaxis protein
MLESDSKVLVVDDQPVVHRIVQKILASRHWGVVESAFSGPEAVRRLSMRRGPLPALVLCERRLLPLNAIDLRVLMASRPDWNAIPFVAMTRIEGENDADKLAAVGIVHRIVKPFSADALLAVLEQALSGAAAAA